MAEPFLSELRLFSFVFPPRGWALCNGQLLPINQNQALFSLLGTSFGGDGRVNFALADLRGRVPIHVGNNHTLGESGGEQFQTLSIAELPGHHHPPRATSNSANQTELAGGIWAKTTENHYGSSAQVAMRADMVSNTGGNQAHMNMQPFLTLSFCIALQGIFPSPN